MSTVTDKPLIPKVKKSISIEIEEKNQVHVIEEKQKEILALTLRIKKLQAQKLELEARNDSKKEEENDQIGFLKQKIAQQLQLNDKMAQTFEEAIGRIDEIITLLSIQLNETSDQSEIQGIISILGNRNSLYQSSYDSEILKEEDIEEIQDQFDAKLNDLEMVASQFRRTLIQVHQKNLKASKRLQNLHLQKIEKEKNVHRELLEEKEKKNHFKELLEQTEREKNDLLNQIASITLGQARKQLNDMNREQLLNLINKLFYRIKDLEDEKCSFTKQISKKNVESIEKYQKLLLDVKEAREKNKLNFSVY